MLHEIGLTVDLEFMCENFVGKSLATCMEQVQSMLNKELPADFLNDLKSRTNSALNNSVQAVTGIQAALDELTLPTCVASSGGHAKMRMSLGATNLYSRFSGRIYSAEEVEQGKPHPDIYLYAARQMSVHPSACVVVEDSVPGVVAGKAAGMRVIGYAERTPAEKLEHVGADMVIKDMSLLNATIAALG